MENLFIPRNINDYLNHLLNNFKNNQERIEYINSLLIYSKNNLIAGGILTNNMMEIDKYYYQAIEDSKLRNLLPMFNFVSSNLIERYANSLNIKEKIVYLEYVIKEYEKENAKFEYRKYNKQIKEFQLELDYNKNMINKTIIIEELLNKETFLKYKEGFKWGFFTNEFERDLESIISINEKIIFLNYVENQLQDYIEVIKLTLDLHNSKIKNYYNNQKYYDDIINKERAKRKEELKAKRNNEKFKERIKNDIKFKKEIKRLDELILEKNNYQYLLDEQYSLKEKIDYLKDSLFFLKEKQDFWSEQLKIKKNYENTDSYLLNTKNENKISKKSNTMGIENDLMKYKDIYQNEFLNEIKNSNLKNLFVKLQEYKFQNEHYLWTLCVSYGEMRTLIYSMDNISDRITVLEFLKKELKIYLQFLEKSKENKIFKKTKTKNDGYLYTITIKYKCLDEKTNKYYYPEHTLYVREKLLLDTLNEITNDIERFNDIFGKNQLSFSNMNKAKNDVSVKTVNNSLNIKWLMYDSDLYYLIYKIELKYNQKNVFKEFIKNNFVSYKGKPFSEKCLPQGEINLTDNKEKKHKSRNSKLINEILSKSYQNNNVNIDVLLDKLIEYNCIKKSDEKKLSQLKSIINI